MASFMSVAISSKRQQFCTSEDSLDSFPTQGFKCSLRFEDNN